MSKSLISLCFLLIWNWNNKYVRTFPYPIPDQNEQSLYPFSHQNGAKPPAFKAAHTYTTY